MKDGNITPEDAARIELAGDGLYRGLALVWVANKFARLDRTRLAELLRPLDKERGE
jgi:hypothetical protein